MYREEAGKTESPFMEHHVPGRLHLKTQAMPWPVFSMIRASARTGTLKDFGFDSSQGDTPGLQV